MSSATTRRSTRRASSGSSGGPQIPWPVMRMAPNPSRWTSRSPPRVSVSSVIAGMRSVFRIAASGPLHHRAVVLGGVPPSGPPGVAECQAGGEIERAGHVVAVRADAAAKQAQGEPAANRQLGEAVGPAGRPLFERLGHRAEATLVDEREGEL